MLRFYALGSKSLWLDEAFSVDRAKLTQDQIWSGQYDPVHPPLYYSCLHAWVGLIGDSETAVRLLSAISSTLSLGAVYLLGRQLLGNDTALVAITVMAFSPLDIWYAQEARMYAFVQLTGLLVSLGLLWRHWLGVFLAGFTLAVGLYFDYTMVPLWVGISAVWFVVWSQKSQKIRYLFVWLIASASAWYFYRPWIPRLQNMLERVNNVVFFSRVRALAGLPALSAPQYLLGMALIGLGVFIVSRVFSLWLQKQKFRQIVTLIVLLGFVSAILLFAVPRFYTIKRILVTGWPYVILSVAWVIVKLERRKYQVWRGLMGLSLLSSVVVLVTPKDDWRSVVSFFNQNNAFKSVIWMDPGWDRMPYNYYDPLYEVKYGAIDELRKVAQNNEIWLIAERYLGQPVPSSTSEVWLEDNLHLEETVSFYRLELRHYRPKE